MLLQVSSCDVQLLGKAEQVEGHWPAARPVTTSRTAKVAATTTTAGFILSFEMHRWVRSGRPEWQVWHTAARESHCSSGGSQFGFTRSPGHAFQLANQNHPIIFETFKTFFKFNVIANSRTVQKIYFTNDGKCAWEHRRRG